MEDRLIMLAHGPAGSGAPVVRAQARARVLTIASARKPEAVAATLLDDEAGMREVPGQDHRARIRVTLDERAPRVARLGRVVAEAARPLGLGDLHRAVHEIAGEDSAPRRRREAHAHVAGRVAEPRLEAAVLRELEVAVDEQRLARLDHRHDAVGDASGFFLAGVVLVLPELPLRAGDDVLRLREGRHPAPLLPARV